MALGTDGNLYVADVDNHAIRLVVLATGAVSTLAGSASGSNGTIDGVGTNAQFNQPSGVAIDKMGNMYVADSANMMIRKIILVNATVSTFAGSAGAQGASNGIGAAASFNYPIGLAVDTNNLYVADASNSLIRKISLATQTVSTLAGSSVGSSNGVGTNAGFSAPSGLALDRRGSLYVTDTGNHLIRKIVLTSQTVSTLAGSTTQGFADGMGSNAQFSSPRGIALGANRNLFVTDQGNHRVRQIAPSTQFVSTLAGSASNASTDGTGTIAAFATPYGIAADNDGGATLFVTEYAGNRVRLLLAVAPCTVAGTYCAANASSASDAVTCAGGFYCSAGTSSPSVCTAGYHCPPGSSNASGVGACPPGWYCPSGGVERTACPPGSYCGGGNSAPVVCAQHTVTNASGLSACTACVAGSYAHPGSSACEPPWCLFNSLLYCTDVCPIGQYNETCTCVCAISIIAILYFACDS
jgi:sugar lactone lactonase YvrE